MRLMLDASMLLIVPLLAGLSLGFFSRGKMKSKVNLSGVTVAVIVVLIFSLGFSIGSNDALLESLPRVGAASVLLMFLAVGFSVLLVAVARKRMQWE